MSDDDTNNNTSEQTKFSALESSDATKPLGLLAANGDVDLVAHYTQLYNELDAAAGSDGTGRTGYVRDIVGIILSALNR
jgi:hypothetical protein